MLRGIHRKILSLLIAVSTALLGVLVTTFFGSLVFLVFPFGQKAAHVIHRMWARSMCIALGLRLSFIGTEHFENISSMILAPNHESMADIFVVGSLPIDFKWIAKMQLKSVPLVGQVMQRFGFFFVQRDKSGRDLEVMKHVEEGLRAGKSLVVFPEGTRTRTGQLLPFKKGAFRLAQNAQVPLIPIAITGTKEIAAPGSLPERWGHPVIVRVGKPFFIPPKAEIHVAMEAFKIELIGLLQQDRKGYPHW